MSETTGQNGEPTHGVTTTVDEHGVAHVVLDRPAKKNALDKVMFDQIETTLAALEANSDVRVVVLSGRDGAFCAGIDLAFLAGGTAGQDIKERTHASANLYQHVCWGWRELSVPVIAAIDGVCFGGGLQIALGADIRIATPDARLAVMEARWGLVPDMAGFPLMRGLVRANVMRELVYTGRQVSGAEAAEIGLVTRTAEDPHAAALDLARAIAVNSTSAVRADKRLLRLTLEEYAGSAELLMAESVEQELLIDSPEVKALLSGR